MLFAVLFSTLQIYFCNVFEKINSLYYPCETYIVAIA